MKHWWPHLRAALIALHVVAVVLGATPVPEGGMRRSDWKEATVQVEFDTWYARVSSLAPGMSREEFEQRLWDVASGWSGGLEVVLGPFQPYYRYFGTEQSWRMFVAPHRYPTRLWIEIRDTPSSAWRPLYANGSPEYRWNASTLESDRFRSAVFLYGWASHDGAYQELGRWLADRAAEEFPDGDAIRTRWFRYRTPSPAEVLAEYETEHTFERYRIYDLADHRREDVP